MRKRFGLATLALSLSLTGLTQATQEPRSTEPGQPVEREIAGGQTHTYQIKRTTGQFMRIRVAPQDVNVALTLIATDGKQVATVNFARFGGPESLSWEATVGGDYRLTVRALGAAFAGAYQARLELKGAAAAQDRRQLAIERLLAEANQSNSQGAAGAQQTLDRAQQAQMRNAEQTATARTAQFHWPLFPSSVT